VVVAGQAISFSDSDIDASFPGCLGGCGNLTVRLR
jgi:hypothetical protein